MKPLTPQMQQHREELLNRMRRLTEEGDAAAVKAVEQMELFLRDKNNLLIQLYNATGTWDEYVAASGLGGLKDNLHEMIAMAQGRTYERAPQRQSLALIDVQDKLKQILVSDKKALSIHSELMKLESELKACVNEALAGASAKKSAQFKDDLNELLQLESESLDWIRHDKLHNVAISADPNAPEQQLYHDIALSDSALSKVVIDGRKKWNYTATPGSPNDEPVLHWASQKNALMMMRYPEMKQKLSYVTTYFIYYFHEDKNTALERWLKDFQKQFSEKPTFLDQCLHELSEVYKHENRMKDSIVFSGAIGAMPTVGGEADGDMAVPKETLYLHVPEGCGLNSHQFWQAVWAEADAKGVDYQGFSLEGFQTVKGYPGEFTTIRIGSADQAKLEEIAFVWLHKFLAAHSQRSGPFGEILVERGGKFTVWPEK